LTNHDPLLIDHGKTESLLIENLPSIKVSHRFADEFGNSLASGAFSCAS